MGLEAATYITQLISSNPVSSDTGGQGDDHIRLIKGVLASTFPNASRAFRVPASVATLTTNTTLTAPTIDGQYIPVDARAAVRTITLPTSNLFDGLRTTIVKVDFSNNNVTVSGNGNTINGATSQLLHQAYQTMDLVWSSNLSAWIAHVAQIPPTGSWLDYSGNSAPDGYVLASGLTIGNASSAGTARANADCLALFQLLWSTYSDTICPVSGGRGSTALADFDANKRITLLDLRGRTRFGDDNMGGSTAGRITNSGSGIVGTTLGASGGSEDVTIPRNCLPNVSLTVSGTTNNSGTHTHPVTTFVHGVGGAEFGSGFLGDEVNVNSGAGGNHSHTVSGTTSSINGGVTQQTLNKMPPAIIQSMCLKL